MSLAIENFKEMLRNHSLLYLMAALQLGPEHEATEMLQIDEDVWRAVVCSVIKEKLDFKPVARTADNGAARSMAALNDARGRLTSLRAHHQKEVAFYDSLEALFGRIEEGLTVKA